MTDTDPTHPHATTDARWHVAITALVTGATNEKAAEAAGVSRSTLQRWLREAEFRVLLSEAEAVVTEAGRTRIRGLIDRAISVVDRCLDSPDDKVALAAAKVVISGLAKAEPAVIEVRAAPSNVEPTDVHSATERLRALPGGRS